MPDNSGLVINDHICVYLSKCSHILDDIDNRKTQQYFYSLHLRHMYDYSVHIRRCLKKSDDAIRV